jgi:hypothetical protein
MGRLRNTICRPPREAQLSPQKGHRFASLPPAALVELPTTSANVSLKGWPRAISPPRGWKREYVYRAARIFRCMDRGQAGGKRLHEMLVWFTWRWKGRHYKSDPKRRIQLGYGTLKRLYRRWKASGGNPAAIALKYRAPVKLRKGHVLDFARVCINSPSRSFAEAYGRLPRPRATVFAYRLHLGPKLLRRIIRLFGARRSVDVRCRWARAAVNSFATEGAK